VLAVGSAYLSASPPLATEPRPQPAAAQ